MKDGFNGKFGEIFTIFAKGKSVFFNFHAAHSKYYAKKMYNTESYNVKGTGSCEVVAGLFRKYGFRIIPMVKVDRN